LAIVVARRSWVEISLWKIGKGSKKEKEHTKKAKSIRGKRRDGIRTAELNRRDQVTAANSSPNFHRKTGAKVDNQVAALTGLGTPTMHRAKIAQPRVRMEGWRQRRPSSNARNPQEGKRKQKEQTEEQTEKRKTHLTHTGQLMEGASSPTRLIHLSIHVTFPLLVDTYTESSLACQK
jgi:hypothetical protein